jgi:hypothetical protein
LDAERGLKVIIADGECMLARQPALELVGLFDAGAARARGQDPVWRRR